MSHSELGKINNYENQLGHILSDANHLLAYAVETGIEVESDIAQKIIAADKQGKSYWGGSEGGELLAAIAKLASKLHPVTAETLRACREEARDAITMYKRLVYVLAIILVPASILGAIVTGITNTINSQIKDANEIVLGLHTSLSTPSAKIAGLQQLAIRARAIRGRANQLNIFNVAGTKAPENLELPDNLDPANNNQITEEVADTTQKYQKIRLYATNVLDATSIFFGAVSTSILPVLYALLGACAAVLRAFTQQLEKRTFTWSYASPARFIIAAIGGGVIGLFNITIGEGVTASPLALAFLVGYLADVFFSFLEGSLPNVGRNTTSAPARPAGAK